MEEVTTKHIASRLGVSASTVSRALQGKAVSLETIRKVREVAEELGYRPNIGARMMVSGKTGMYGLLVPSTTNPYFGNAVEIFQTEAFKHGYYINLGVYQEDLDEFRKYIELLVLERRVDGLIIFPMHDARILGVLAQVASERIPIVMMGQTLIEGIHCVDVDLEKGGRAMAFHLLDQGHTRIGVIQGHYGREQVQISTFRETRVSGLEHAMLERGLNWACDELLVRCETSMQGGYEAARRLLALRPQPTAIFAINDMLALGALRAVSEAGLRVPEDISVAGFDNTPFAEFHGLTTGDMHMDRLADAALNILSRATHKSFDHAQTLRKVIQPVLVVRGSTGPVVAAQG